MATTQEEKTNIQVQIYLERSFAKNTISTLTQEGHTLEYAEAFAEDLFFVDWSEHENDEERELAFRLLGFNYKVWEDFSSVERLNDGLAALLRYEKINLKLAQRATEFYLERAPDPNPAYLVAEVIIECFGLDLHGKVSLDLQREYWLAHGMGYVPGQLYPYYSKEGPIYRASLAAIRAGLKSAGKSTAKANLELTANFIAHEVYAGMVMSEAHVFDAVRDAMEKSIFGHITDPLPIMRRHQTAATRGYWKSLGIDTDERGTPLFG